MKSHRESHTCLQLYTKYSLISRKTPSEIVNIILSYLNSSFIADYTDTIDPKCTDPEGTVDATDLEFTDPKAIESDVTFDPMESDGPEDITVDCMKKRKINHTLEDCKINKVRKINYTEDVNHFIHRIDSGSDTHTSDPGSDPPDSETTEESPTTIVTTEETHTPTTATYITETPHNTPTDQVNGSDLIFDMKYCSLQLPIPLELYTADDTSYTLESEDEIITNFDICYDEELASNLIMAEPFRFLCKVHITFDDKFGHQWCCCYFDAKGNYTKKRFNTSDLAFDTAKMLAHRCREAAEHTFHNIWILKHKNALNQPIPNNLNNSLLNLIHRVKSELNSDQCPNCSINNIKHILHSQ